ncbi:unnamed protein product [Schistosoma mattheei]|uniref:Uncharacterized protein n=1 Tax=Schistosoma mattheei TaxID=31246 RepID=A0A183NIJ0_9TREM|nr:unnamed protein product [Schistosoma mattheei]
MLMYSGHDEENAPYIQRVALMLSKEARKALVGWACHGPMVFKTKNEAIAMNVMQRPMIRMTTIQISSTRGCNRSCPDVQETTLPS